MIKKETDEKGNSHITFDWSEFIETSFSWKMKVAVWVAALIATVGYIWSESNQEKLLHNSIKVLEESIKECDVKVTKLEYELNKDNNLKCIEAVRKCYPDIFTKSLIEQVFKK